jgi:hypothetical protein
VIAQSLLAFIGNGTLQEGLEKLEGITLLDYRGRGDILAERDPVMQFGKYSVHRVDPAGLGRAGPRQQDHLDRNHLPQSTSYGLQPAVKKGGRGRLIGLTKGGMNHCPAVDT